MSSPPTSINDDNDKELMLSEHDVPPSCQPSHTKNNSRTTYCRKNE